MQFNPPVINNISDVLPSIEGNTAFIVAEKGWYTVIDYVYAHRDTFTNDVARECRGLKFDTATGRLIARPYHKFHNLGECAGYFTEQVDLREPHTVLDKLDGSMIHFALDSYGIPFPMTRMGYTNVAEMAHRFLIEGGCSYADNIHNMVNQNPTQTFIFEYTGPHNRIVIPYEKEELTLTGIRDIVTGAYQTTMGMAAYLARYDVPVVQQYPAGFDLEYIANDNESEGCVVRFDTGAMVKIKSEIYCRKHKSKELSESFKGVVQLIVDNTLDDCLPNLEQKTQDKLLDYQKELTTRLSEYHEGLRHILSLTKELSQKEFAEYIIKTLELPQATCGLLFMTRKSGDGLTEVYNLVRKRYNKEADLVELFETLEFPKWTL